MKIEIEGAQVADINIAVQYLKNGKSVVELIEKKAFQLSVDRRNGRVWKMQVKVGDVLFDRYGQYDWDEYCEQQELLYVDLVAFLLENIRRRDAKYADWYDSH